MPSHSMLQGSTDMQWDSILECLTHELMDVVGLLGNIRLLFNAWNSSIEERQAKSRVRTHCHPSGGQTNDEAIHDVVGQAGYRVLPGS